MKRTPFFAALVLGAAAASLAVPSDAHAQAPGEFTLRAGVDVRPLLYFGGGQSGTIADFGWLGVHVAPGYKLAAGILTIELDLIPLIPISGDNTGFDFLVAPGVWLDLYLLYVRGSLPFGFNDGVNFWFEAAAGISFLGKGYLGLLFDYSARFEAGMIGAEVGFRF